MYSEKTLKGLEMLLIIAPNASPEEALHWVRAAFQRQNDSSSHVPPPDLAT